MIGLLTSQPSAAAAARVLSQVFGSLRGPVAFRLWDGQEVRVGTGAPVVTAVIKSPETFLRLMRNPTPYAFAEAYIESAIDLEGDLFAAMGVANEVEGLRLTPGQKLRALWTLWRG